ncbi:MAG: T9SS type A sorting domain-containing protein [Janthinobacterium lividum]
MLTAIGFSYFANQDTATTGSFRVYLQNTSDATYQKASTNWTTGSTGIIDNMTLVHNASLTIPPSVGNLDIPFSGGNTFTYTGGGLYVAFDYQNATGVLVQQGNRAKCNSDLPGGLHNAYSTSALAADLTNTSDFRPVTRLAYAAPAIGIVRAVYTLGNLLVPGAQPHVVSAHIVNHGEAALVNMPVTLRITGANAFTDVQTIASLAANDSVVVAFRPLNPTDTMALGSNTVSVSIPAYDNSAHIEKSVTQTVSATTLSYADGEDFIPLLGVGFKNDAGLMLAKYRVSSPTRINTVTVAISYAGENIGQTVYGVLLDANGIILSRSADYTLTSSDLGNKHTFLLANPTTFTNQDFYVGLAQTANAVAYYPLAVQEEGILTRPDAYYGGSLAGGSLTEKRDLNRFVILAGGTSSTFAPTPLPVRWVSVTAQRTRADVQVYWQTAMEQNSYPFEVERSTDGQTFAFVGRVAPALATSSHSHTYTYLDAGVGEGGSPQLYYRIKQTELDGTVSYSTVVVVSELSVGKPIPPAYPNPMANRLYLDALPDGATVRVTDMTGRLVYFSTAAAPTLTLPTEGWPKGVYCLQVSAGNQTSLTQRLIK